MRLRQGRGLRVLSPPILSPTLDAQRERLLNLLPEARWHEYEPADDDAARAGARMAFGEEVQPLYHFGQADVVLSIDADFLGFGPARVRAARDFVRRRTTSAGTDATAASSGANGAAASTGADAAAGSAVAGSAVVPPAAPRAPWPRCTPAAAPTKTRRNETWLAYSQQKCAADSTPLAGARAPIARLTSAGCVEFPARSSAKCGDVRRAAADHALCAKWRALQPRPRFFRGAGEPGGDVVTHITRALRRRRNNAGTATRLRSSAYIGTRRRNVSRGV